MLLVLHERRSVSQVSSHGAGGSGCGGGGAGGDGDGGLSGLFSAHGISNPNHTSPFYSIISPADVFSSFLTIYLDLKSSANKPFEYARFL